jgi:uncharacterized membrane protein YoaT (DUF817 family)
MVHFIFGIAYELHVLCCSTFGLKCYFYTVLGQLQKYPLHFIFVTTITFNFLCASNKSLLTAYTYWEQVILQALLDILAQRGMFISKIIFISQL